jgi:hypothetical protein
MKGLKRILETTMARDGRGVGCLKNCRDVRRGYANPIAIQKAILGDYERKRKTFA